MKQFKALLKKEWHTHKGSFLAPVWVTLAIYGVFLIGLLISYAKGNFANISLNPAGIPAMSADQTNVLGWMAVAGTAILLGFITTMIGFGLTDGLINGDRRKRCEIFHLSQPVPLVKMLAAKHAALMLGALGMVFALTLVNSAVLAVAMKSIVGCDFWFCFSGGLFGFVSVVFSYLFATSLMWLFASLFRNKLFLILVLTISGIEASIHLLNYLVGWSIPSLWSYVLRMLNFTIRSAEVSGTKITSALLLQNSWGGLLSVDNIMRVVYSAIFLISGYFIQKHREVL